jgi:hypothetical protein
MLNNCLNGNGLMMVWSGSELVLFVPANGAISCTRGLQTACFDLYQENGRFTGANAAELLIWTHAQSLKALVYRI